VSQGIENLLSNPATLPPPPKRTPRANSADAPDSFEKALQRAKPKRPERAEKKSAPKPDPAQKADPAQEGDPAEEAPQADQAQKPDGDPSQPQATDQPSDEAALQTEPQPTAEKPKKPTDSKADADVSTLVDQAAIATTAPEKPKAAPDQSVKSEEPTSKKPVEATVALATLKTSVKKDTNDSPDANQTEDPAIASEQVAQQQDRLGTPDQPAVQKIDKQPTSKRADPVQPDLELQSKDPIELKPSSKRAAPSTEQTAADVAAAAAAVDLPDGPDTSEAKTSSHDQAPSPSVLTLQTELPTTKTDASSAPHLAAAVPAPPPAPEPDFAAANHDRIVQSVRAQLLPNGGTMHIRLDPPELGAIQVTVRMIDGAMTASFETSNEQAAKLLSHSLGQLKQALESQGVSVEKLHVQQTPRDQQANSGTDDSHQRQGPQDEQLARREEQRREMLNRMWRRLRLGSDPLDMVA
jgi:flagellar hook-length control protein FliK